jgi:hypothetical protein
MIILQVLPSVPAMVVSVTTKVKPDFDSENVIAGVSRWL